MSNLLQLKVVINGTEPPVWRTLHVPDSYNLYQLHHAIQIAFGWENSHLYLFNRQGKTFGNPRLLEDDLANNDRDFLISDLLGKENDFMTYEYDFGDSWMHTIKLESILPNDAGILLPVCIDGERACPPEDCGGLPGFERVKEAMKNTRSTEYKKYIDWLGKQYDPDKFDLNRVNKEMKKLNRYIKD